MREGSVLGLNSLFEGATCRQALAQAGSVCVLGELSLSPGLVPFYWVIIAFLLGRLCGPIAEILTWARVRLNEGVIHSLRRPQERLSRTAPKETHPRAGGDSGAPPAGTPRGTSDLGSVGATFPETGFSGEPRVRRGRP